MIEVLRAGLCDLVMDLGRPGRGALGVPAGGAADPGALAAANRLVGNRDDAAALEITLRGPTLRFSAGGVAAITGAPFAARRGSGAPVIWDQSFVMAPGETLSLGGADDGCRCWLAVQGGIVVPSVMESHSTFLPAGFGGYAGRALRRGDVLALGGERRPLRRLRAQPPAIDKALPLRLVGGPQVAWFDDRGLAALFGGTYRVAPTSDRRGVRLSGPTVTHVRGELASQGVLPGAVQVPPDGQPIVLGWDGPVTGGYPVVGTVVTADLPLLAQLRPGDAVRFSTIDVAAAQLLATSEWLIEEVE